MSRVALDASTRSDRRPPPPQLDLVDPGLGKVAGPFWPFLALLALGLAGYLFSNRAFAYLHVPGTPVFIGEILLGVGLVQVARIAPRLPPLVLRSWFLRLLLAFMALGAFRAMLDFDSYGLLALRDSAIWYYGLFSILIAAVLLYVPDVLPALASWYRRVLPFFLLWAPAVIILNRLLSGRIPFIPGSGTTLLSHKPGDAAVHTALALAFLWLCDGLWRDADARKHTRQALTALGLISILVIGSQNRGGLVAASVAIGIAFALTGAKRPALITAVGSLLFLLAFGLASDFRLELGRREISIQQLRENIGSIVSDPEDDGTTRWRLELWGEIVDDTLSGRNGPVGLGFGLNLAHHYEARSSSYETDQPLRSAHNSHVSVLARMGLPGAVLWLLLWGIWFGGMVRMVRRARSPGSPDPWRASFGGWLIAAVAAILANAIFDPTLEGPQVAIWAWALAGVGVALMHPGFQTPPQEAGAQRRLATRGAVF